MYNNLKNMLFQKCITLKQYANFLGVSEKTVSNKINGITDFSYPEFKNTCNLLFPEINADYLFTDSEPNSKSA